MRRLAAIVLAAARRRRGAAVAVGAGGDDAGDAYRVDAIFDNAGFLIPGQDVKIAGAQVGEVVDVALTRGPQGAHRRWRSTGAFAPVRDDADCTIQPQSLIGEKFVQCTPGTPRGRPLTRRRRDASSASRAPTRRSTPTSCFAALRAPAPERLRIVVAELGGGVAGPRRRPQRDDPPREPRAPADASACCGSSTPTARSCGR